MKLEIFIPTNFDLDKGKFVKSAGIGDVGYAENSEVNLQLDFSHGDIFIDYYSEDDFSVLGANEFYLDVNKTFKENQLEVLNFLLLHAKGEFKKEIKKLIKDNN